MKIVKKGFSREDSYKKSLEVLRECSSKYGFKAAAVNSGNYSRVWARDSMICSLAGLISGEKDLVRQVKKSLQTLLRFQYKHGQIPSNVNVAKKKVSYGSSAGRIDATLWFLVVFSQYIKRTNDVKFLKKNYKKFKRSIELIHLYEFNEKSFVYVPRGGDWADEWIQEGYVLYDQLLYYKAIEEYIYLRKRLHKRIDRLVGKLKILEKKLRVNYWLDRRNINSVHVYHKVVFEREVMAKKRGSPYLLSYFNPSGYNFRFDGFANSLALLFDIFSDEQNRNVHDYILKNFRFLIPAFHPVIMEGDNEWKELKNNYSVTFRNKPYEYHNGGLWPMITGFYVSGLVKYDKKKSEEYLDGINYANFLSKHKGERWGFHEFLNGKTLKPGGVKKQAWSAAAGIMAHQVILKKEKLFL